jgi:hypothetical protein
LRWRSVNWSTSSYLKYHRLCHFTSPLRKPHSRVANNRTRRNLHTVRNKSRSHHILRLLTLTIRTGALASRSLDTIASLNIHPSIFFSRFEVSETKVSNGLQSGKDDNGQADAQQELHEHVDADRWSGVRACGHVCRRRRSGVVVGGWRQFRTVCVEIGSHEG